MVHDRAKNGLGMFYRPAVAELTDNHSGLSQVLSLQVDSCKKYS